MNGASYSLFVSMCQSRRSFRYNNIIKYNMVKKGHIKHAHRFLLHLILVAFLPSFIMSVCSHSSTQTNPHAILIIDTMRRYAMLCIVFIRIAVVTSFNRIGSFFSFCARDKNAFRSIRIEHSLSGLAYFFSRMNQASRRRCFMHHRQNL